jgi:hypothetical protein
MGRRLRRVPLDWTHPIATEGRDKGQPHPTYDKDYETAAIEWLESVRKWEAGEDPDRAGYEADEGRRVFYWEYESGPPDPAYYRHRRWTPGEATAYQVYENVTEGTPISPVLPDGDAVVSWLVEQGHSERAARAFLESGYAPSFVMDTRSGFFARGIDALDR